MVAVVRPWGSCKAKQAETIMYLELNQLGPNWNKIWRTTRISSGYLLFIVNTNDIPETSINWTNHCDYFSGVTAVLITANNNAEHYWGKITWFSANKLFLNAFKTVATNRQISKNKSKDRDSNFLVMSYSEDSFLTSSVGCSRQFGGLRTSPNLGTKCKKIIFTFSYMNIHQLDLNSD